MTIKPVDYSTMLPKTQEVSKIKQVEFDKNKIQREQGVIQQNNKIKKDKRRIKDTNKSEPTKIGIRDNKKGNKKSNYNKDEEGNRGEKKKRLRKIRKVREDVGGNVDIKI